LVLLLESKNEVCLLCEGILEQIPAFNFFCASLESISAIEDTWERCGIANMAFIQLGGNSVTPPDGAWTEYVSEGVTSS
ncbi:hypothetical protein Tco_0243812, partial [Tanacetum coccineum]